MLEHAFGTVLTNLDECARGVVSTAEPRTELRVEKALRCRKAETPRIAIL
jgi:hypothetical protein